MSWNVDEYEEPSHDGEKRAAVVDGDMEETAAKRYSNVSRMSKEERDAHFAEKRRERELEAIKKLGLNPEDFPSARSTVRNFAPLGGGRREEGRRDEGRRGGRQPRPSHGNRRDQGNESRGNEQQSAPVTAQESYNQPQASTGYGDERVSGWGSSSSDDAVTPFAGPSSVTPSKVQSASGWPLDEPTSIVVPPGIPAQSSSGLNISGLSLDEPAPAVPRPVPAAQSSRPVVSKNPNDLSVSGWSLDEPTPMPTFEAPKPTNEDPKPAVDRPAAPSRNVQSDPNDLDVSGWDISEPIPTAAPAAVPALVADAAPSGGDNWKIDRAPVGQIPERRPLYSYDAEPAAPSRPVEPVKPIKPVKPIRPAEPKAPVNPLEPVDSWGCVDPLPMAAPAPKPVPVQSAPVPVAPVQPAPAPVPSALAPASAPAPRVPSKPAGNPLEYVETWNCEDPIPTVQPVTQPAPVQVQRVPEPAPIQAPRVPEPTPIARGVAAVSRAAPRPAANLLEPVDSWACEDPIPMAAPAAPFVPVAAPAVPAPFVPEPPKQPAPAPIAPVAPVVAPVVPLPTFRQKPPRAPSKPAGNPLEYVDSWSCEDPIPTAPTVPTPAPVPVVAAPSNPAMAPGTVKCPNCQHCFRP